MCTIMSVKSRKLSLDSSVYLDMFIGGKRSSNKNTGKKPRQSPSLDEAQQQSQELNGSLSSDLPLRKESMTKESLEQSDELINHHSFIKYNKMFHKLFQEIPEEENLTHAFTCAMQKEVLYHGKLFVSENHVCFHSSVLLKDTKVVIPASSIMKVKKQNTALSMLAIQTADDEKYSFVSLRNRQICYKLLQTVCSHAREKNPNSGPRLSSAENEVDDTASSYSSLEECCGLDLSRESSLCLDNDFPHMSSEGATRTSSTRHSSLADEDDRASSWIWRIVERVSPFFLFRQIRNLSFLFHFYMMLMMLLLLASGYIGMRISELEERLRSLGDLTEMSLYHTEYQAV